MNKLWLCVVFTATLFVVAVESTAQQSDDQKDEKKPIERVALKVLVVDPNGNPVQGAVVKPGSMIFDDEPSVSFGWPDDEAGKTGDILTDEDGTAFITWPKPPLGTTEVSRIGFKVTHSAFVDHQQFSNVQDAPVTIQLERGFRIAATAVNADSGESIKEGLYASTNRHSPVDWKQKTNGTLVSPVFGKEECTFRLTQILDGKAVRFSKLIGVDPDEQSRFMFRDVELVKSIEIRGQLDEQIPRPIKAGLISACVSSIRDEDRAKRHTAWHWETFAFVAEDGSFLLEGIPTGSEVQIIAICEGWMNVPLTKGEMMHKFPSYARNNNDMFMLPQLVAAGKESTNTTIKMQKTGRCSVSVVDENGAPIVNATVSANPNQLFFHSGITSGFGSAWSTSFKLQKLREKDVSSKKLERYRSVRSSFKYAARTNERGVAVIENLPSRMVSGSVRHDDYKPASGLFGHQFNLRVKEGEDSNVKVTLNKPDH